MAMPQDSRQHPHAHMCCRYPFRHTPLRERERPGPARAQVSWRYRVTREPVPGRSTRKCLQRWTVTVTGRALPSTLITASLSSASRTLERHGWIRGQLFHGVTRPDPSLPLQHAPVTCVLRHRAQGPRSQGPATRTAFQAFAPPTQVRTARMPLWQEIRALSARFEDRG